MIISQARMARRMVRVGRTQGSYKKKLSSVEQEGMCLDHNVKSIHVIIRAMDLQMQTKRSLQGVILSTLITAAGHTVQ